MNLIKILLIEDDPGDADLIQELLLDEPAYSYAYVCAETLKMGLAHLARGGLDVVLLDLSLPDSQGIDTFLSVHSRAPTVPIVVLTGYDDKRLALDAVRHGAQDYLVKGKVDGRVIVRVIQYAIERKRAEEAMRESEARFRSAFDYAAIGMALVGIDGSWIKVNTAFCEIVGYAEVELLGMNFQDITHPDDLETSVEYFQQLLQGTRQYYHLEKRFIHRQGYEIWVDNSSSLVRNGQGQPLYIVAQIQDITRRKQVEEELAHRVEELARSNQELEQFAYVASHDLQEPLRMVASYTQLLARRYTDHLDDDANEFIAFAVDGVRRMQQLINDLLLYARVGTQGKAFELTSCEMVLDNALIDLQSPIRESGAVITHDPLPAILADASQLRQVFENLIGNAIKFRSDKLPHIHISAEQQGREWVFAVRDNGIGLESEYAERIFVIFQRLHGIDQYRGTGIGLAICKKIVERHGGRIWVESQLRQGSTFYFTIPLKGAPRPRVSHW